MDYSRSYELSDIFQNQLDNFFKKDLQDYWDPMELYLNLRIIGIFFKTLKLYLEQL